MQRPRRYPIPAAAYAPSAFLLSPMLPASAEVVVKVGMASPCAEAAATELRRCCTCRSNGGTYHFYGQYPASGQDLTLFKCHYGGNSIYLGISMAGHRGERPVVCREQPNRPEPA